jgi:hypothetical protein
MHVLLIVVGLLLLMFGGGCTLISVGYLLGGTNDIMRELRDGWWILVFFGLVPLGVGIWMVRAGMRIDRQKRKAAVPPQEPPKP